MISCSPVFIPVLINLYILYLKHLDLKKISELINSSLGGLNNIEPVIDETENRIYFVDYELSRLYKFK